MNRGLLRKSIGETWKTTLLVGAGLFVFELLIAAVLPSFQADLSEVFKKLKIVQYVFAALLGAADLDVAIGPEALSAMRWVHPFVLTLLWAHAIIVGTRIPAGEIDRGTIDVLLALPNSRMSHYASDSLVCAASGLVVILLAAAGVAAGALGSDQDQPMGLRVQLMICVNLYLLYLAVAGLVYLVSSVLSHRGRAAGVVFAVLAASFVINTLAVFNKTIAHLSFLGILRYYRPLVVMTRQAWPWIDLAVLAGVCVVFWGLGAMFFSRRDIRTV